VDRRYQFLDGSVELLETATAMDKRVDYTDKKDPGQCPDAGATYVKHRVTETGGYFGSLKNLGPIPKGATPL
jgi:hypothetical protein